MRVVRDEPNFEASRRIQLFVCVSGLFFRQTGELERGDYPVAKIRVEAPHFVIAIGFVTYVLARRSAAAAGRA
jgi:hypothetical protein